MHIRHFLAVIAAYLLLTTLYNFAIPAGEAPDEPEHARYTRIILETGQFPTIPLNSARYAYEAEQPPLYYILSAGWIAALWPNTRIFPDLPANPDFDFSKETPYNVYLHTYPAQDDVPAHLLRLLSTLIGLVTLLLIWITAREAWPDPLPDTDQPSPNSHAALIALGFAALLPGFTFTSATITNDSIAAALGAAITYLCIRIIRRGITLPLAIGAGAVLGLGLMSKWSIVVFAPLLVIACLLASKQSWRTRITNIIVIGATSIAVGIWPFLSNFLEYGDPTASAARMAAKHELASPLANMPFFWLDRGYIAGLLDSLWGVFGLRNMSLPGLAYIPYYLLFLAGIGAALYSLRKSNSAHRKIILILSLALIFIYAGVAYQNTQFWAIQGRLLLPGFCALALLIGTGTNSLIYLLPARLRTSTILPIALLVGLFFLNLYALVGKLIVSYYS
ncbi:MAG: glycosyltransferase family 39 protein [Chloroflexia bacterium]